MRLAYPKWLDRTPVTVVITAGQDEDGTPLEVCRWDGKCRMAESTCTAVDKDGRRISLQAVLYICGDIAPDQPVLSGYVELQGKRWQIQQARRPRNPDGSVNHTKLEVV